MESPHLDELESTPRSGMLSRIGDLWCRLMHRDVMWPIHGKFQCRKCFRTHPITWGDHIPQEFTESTRAETRFK